MDFGEVGLDGQNLLVGGGHFRQPTRPVQPASQDHQRIELAGYALNVVHCEPFCPAKSSTCFH